VLAADRAKEALEFGVELLSKIAGNQTVIIDRPRNHVFVAGNHDLLNDTARIPDVTMRVVVTGRQILAGDKAVAVHVEDVGVVDILHRHFIYGHGTVPSANERLHVEVARVNKPAGNPTSIIDRKSV